MLVVSRSGKPWRRLLLDSVNCGVVVDGDLLFLLTVSLLPFLPSVPLDVEKVKRSSGSTQRRYPRKLSLDPHLWDRLEVVLRRSRCAKRWGRKKRLGGSVWGFVGLTGGR